MSIDRNALAAASLADSDCQRNSCKVPECNGFLCHKAIEAYLAALPATSVSDAMRWLTQFLDVLRENPHRYADDIDGLERVASALTEHRSLAEGRPTHRHKKRGSEYVLIGFGKMQAEEWRVRGWNDVYQTETFSKPVDMREVAIYRSATDPNEMWVRPREEFEDGRFEPLPQPPEAK